MILIELELSYTDEIVYSGTTEVIPPSGSQIQAKDSLGILRLWGVVGQPVFRADGDEIDLVTLSVVKLSP